MEGRFFEPDDKFCIIFDNVSYGKLRELPEFSVKQPHTNDLKYSDMPQAREWADEFERGI